MFLCGVHKRHQHTLLSGFSFFITLEIVLSRTEDWAAGRRKNKTKTQHYVIYKTKACLDNMNHRPVETIKVPIETRNLLTINGISHFADVDMDERQQHNLSFCDFMVLESWPVSHGSPPPRPPLWQIQFGQSTEPLNFISYESNTN